MNLDIEKAIMFQNKLNLALLHLINIQVDDYDKYSRGLDKLEIELMKQSCKVFANSKEDLIRYIETAKDMPTPEIDLLQVISETFYRITDYNADIYKITISVEGLREYIEKAICLIVEQDEIRNYSKLPYEEYRFGKEILKRYLVKKFFKDLNDRGRISIEFEIHEILRYMDIDENNTSYDKFSNLKKFKIDKMMPVIKKALGLDIEVFTVNLGRNTERLYLECVDNINPKKYARQLKDKYDIGITKLEKVMKEVNEILCGKKKLKFKTIIEGEYLFNLGEIEFKCIVAKTINYKVDVNVQYSIKNKLFEFIISEDILNKPLIYTRNGERALEYALFIIANYIDDIATIMCGMIIKKEFEMNICESNYEEERRNLGPLLTKNGNITSYQIIRMEKDIVEEVNIKGEHIIKVSVNLEPTLRVNISKLINSINDNSDEYLKQYDLENIDTLYEKGVPSIEKLMFNFNLEREETYVNIPSIKFIGILDKEVKKEINWNSKNIIEYDDILSIRNTEKEFLSLYVEKYVHDNLVAMCNSGDILKCISKELAKKLSKYYEQNDYINTKYEKKYMINYRELIY